MRSAGFFAHVTGVRARVRTCMRAYMHACMHAAVATGSHGARTLRKV